jgi:hypothetical protein
VQRNPCEEERGHRYLIGKTQRTNFGAPPDYIRLLREAVTCQGEGYKIFPETAATKLERLRWLEERGYDHHFTIMTTTRREWNVVRNEKFVVDDHFVMLVINDPDGAFWLRTVFGNRPMPDDGLEKLRKWRYNDEDSWWL